MTEDCKAAKVVLLIKKRDHVWKHLVESLPKKITPNHVSIFRLFLAIPIIVLIISHFNKIAGGLFLLAAILDWLDGSMARIRNQITKLGAYLDPTADKVVNFAAFLGFIYTIQSDYYFYLVIPIIVIDFFLFFIATFKYAIVCYPKQMSGLSRRIKILTAGANKYGKIKMVLQVIAISFLLIFNPLFSFSLPEKYGIFSERLTLLECTYPLLIACVAFGVLSIIGHIKAMKIIS